MIVAKETLPWDLPQLSHERLEVYQKSIGSLALTTKLIRELPRGHGELVDQRKRAALSIPLNIAEASGRTGCLDNAKHFAIARGSALECGAIFDACKAMQIIDSKIHQEGKGLLVSAVSMLLKLCHKKP